MNIVCWGTGLQRVIPMRDQSRETLRNAYRTNWLRSYGKPRIHVVDQQRSWCSGIFAEKAETRLEVNPWKHRGAERASKHWKKDDHKTTQDGPEAQTCTDFAEDCDAVNQARASKINDSAFQRVFGINHPQMEDAVWEFGRANPGVVSRQQTKELAQERSMTMPSRQVQPWTTNVAGDEPCTTLRNTTRANCMLDNPSCFGDVVRMQPRNQQTLFGTRAWSLATHWPQFGLPTAVPQSSVHDPR